MGALDAEIARLSRRVKTEGRSTAFVALADALRRAERHAEALQVLREGLRSFPDYGPARVVLARIHLDTGHRAHAEEVLQDVVRVNGENLAAISALARLWMDDGRRGDAAPLVERLRHAAPDDPAVAAWDRTPAAAPARVPPSDPFASPRLAGAFARKGHYDRALRVWRSLAEAWPDDPEVRARIGALERALAGHGDVEGEPPLPSGGRRLLPGAADTAAALLDDADAPPSARGMLGTWARLFWRTS